jgi:hypothetical protein
MLDQVTRVNALVEAAILMADLLDEGGHRQLLVVRARKEDREAAAGDARCDLWHVVRCSANGSDVGTCKSVAVW